MGNKFEKLEVRKKIKWQGDISLKACLQFVFSIALLFFKCSSWLALQKYVVPEKRNTILKTRA